MYSYPNLRQRRRNEHADTHDRSRPQAGRGDGRTRDAPLKQQLLLISGALAAFAALYLTPVSEIVTNALLLPMIPLESDYEMGRQALLELPESTVSWSTWSPLLKRVSNDLIQTFDENENNRNVKYVWDVAIVRSDAINAFALPGGVIRVTDTLLQAIHPTKGELAALVGHEMGHVIHRHSQARVLQSKIVSWIIQALIYNDRDEVKETYGQAMGELLAKSAAWLGQQRFSRRDEYQADATSWELLANSGKYGYTPQSLHSLLEKLWKMEKGQSDNKVHVASVLENWSRTHPATKDRLDALDQKWKALPVQEQRRLGRNSI
jgi:Zn-dependent protease with chaperone function